MGYPNTLKDSLQPVDKLNRLRGILEQKVICVAPGHNKFVISVFSNVVNLWFLFKRVKILWCLQGESILDPCMKYN